MAFVAAAAAIVCGVGPSLPVMAGAAVVFGAALGLATTSVYAAVGQRVSPGERGAALGFLQTAYLIGLAVSPVIAGFIGATSMRAVFFADAIGLAGLAWFVHARMTPGPVNGSGGAA
jgi:MFS family permease